MEATKTEKKARQIKTADTKKAPAAVKPKPAVVAATEKKAAAPRVNPHEAAGIVSRYTGASDLFTHGRKVAIKQISGLTTNDMTDRRRAALYDLRDGYGNKPFPAKGWDNGSLRDLAAIGMVTLSGGTKQGDYLMDGATPVLVQLTKAGLEYGVPAKA